MTKKKNKKPEFKKSYYGTEMANENKDLQELNEQYKGEKQKVLVALIGLLLFMYYLT